MAHNNFLVIKNLPIGIFLLFFLFTEINTEIELRSEKSLHANGNSILMVESDIAVESSKVHNGKTKYKFLWPDRVVPFEFDEKINETTQQKILEFLSDFNSLSCVKFRHHDTQSDYVEITQEGKSCWSEAGRTGGKQMLNLPNDCLTKATVLHESLHAVGFWHEQSRKDRDKYVKILWENIDIRSQYNFNIVNTQLTHFPYDYSSLLHYGPKAFSKNGRFTIFTKDISKQQLIGQNKAPSSLDREKLNDLYACNKLTRSSEGLNSEKTITVYISDVFREFKSKLRNLFGK